MCLPVAAHQPRSVHGKDHRQILNAHIMEYLVVCPLQKRGVYGHNGLQASRRKPCRKSHRMLFRDPHIEETVRVHIAEPFQACAVRHGRRDSHNFFITLPQLAHDRGKDVRIIGVRSGMGRNPRPDIEGLRAVKSGGMALRRQISLALLGQHMNQHGPLHTLGITDHGDHGGDVMTVHRPQISDPHIFKKHPRNHQLFEAALGPADPVDDVVPPFHTLQGIVDPLFQIQIPRGSADIVQIFGHASHVLGDGHIVVVEDHDEIGLQLCGIVQGLVSHSPCEGAIPNDGHHGIRPAGKLSGFHQTQPCRYGGGTMPRVKYIAFAFFSFWKTAEAMILAQRTEIFPSSGENFVCIGLMPHIPDDFILRQVQNKVQRHSQFHCAQIGAQMPPCHADGPNQKIPNLLRQRVPVLFPHPLYIIRLLYGFQKHISPYLSHHILSKAQAGVVAQAPGINASCVSAPVSVALKIHACPESRPEYPLLPERVPPRPPSPYPAP